MATYARQAVARSSTGWDVSGNSATLHATTSFPAVATGSTTVTHVGVGLSSSGAGTLEFIITLTVPIVIAPGITPQLDTSVGVTQASGDAMASGAATAFLQAVFQNAAWSGISAALGTAGSFYLSLHTASPGEGGSQSTNEVSYS